MPPSTFEDTVHATICQGLENLYKDGQLCDLAVEVGTSTFSCHSVVLAAVSEYFQDALHFGNPGGYLRIRDKEVSAEAFAKVLDILYKGKDLVNDIQTAMAVLQISVLLKITFLQDHCKTFLHANITPATCFEVWHFANKHDITSLEETARKTACSGFEELTKCENFVQFPSHFLQRLMSSEELKITSEDNLCKTIMNWISYDSEGRMHLLPEFLPYMYFTNITGEYMLQLRQFAPNSSMELLEYLEEYTTLRLETALKLNSTTKAEIMARYNRTPDTSDMERSLILVGGLNASGNSTTQVTILSSNLNPAQSTHRPAAPLPTDCGTDFATCVWRNEIYVSGGSKTPAFFAVYNSGIDKWKVLPNLPRGIEKHSMVAVNWKIYILGGLAHLVKDNKCSDDSITTFNLKTKAWDKIATLIKPLCELSSAVVGHRIYVVGGRDADHNATDLIQCVDTRTGCVCIAGHLESPTFGACCLSAGGNSFYAVLCEGELLQIKENSAERKQNVPRNETSNNENEKTMSPKVRVLRLAKISMRRHFSACLRYGDVLVCGGQVETGTFLQHTVSVELMSGKVTEMAGMLPAPASHFKTHLINVPKPKNNITFRFNCKVDTLTEGNYVYSQTVKLHNSCWRLQCIYVNDSGRLYLGAYLGLCLDETRNVNFTVRFSIWIVPVKPGVKEVLYSSSPCKFGGSSLAMGWKKFISFEDLTDLDKGYVKDGEVTLETSITIL